MSTNGPWGLRLVYSRPGLVDSRGEQLLRARERGGSHGLPGSAGWEPCDDRLGANPDQSAGLRGRPGRPAGPGPGAGVPGCPGPHGVIEVRAWVRAPWEPGPRPQPCKKPRSSNPGRFRTCGAHALDARLNWVHGHHWLMRKLTDFREVRRWAGLRAVRAVVFMRKGTETPVRGSRAGHSG